MVAIRGRKTIQEIAADHAIHPIQVSQWRRQLLDGASELLTRGSKSKKKEEVQSKEVELFQQIGKLQMEMEWLNKSLNRSDARERRKMVDHDHPQLSVSRQCALLGLPRSTLRIMASLDALYLEDPCSGSRWMVDLTHVTSVDQAWATDITYVPLQKGFLDLGAIMDLHSRHVYSFGEACGYS